MSNEVVIYDLPSSWAWVALGDLVDRLQYGYTASADSSVTGVRLLRITDIKPNGVDWNIVPGCLISDSDFGKYSLIDGDLVFARSGSIEKAIQVTKPPKSVFASYLIRGRPLYPAIGTWVGRFVYSRHYLEQIGAVGAGSGMQNVNAQKLASVQVPIPPFTEQHRIVAQIEALQARSRKAREALEAIPPMLEQFRQSVLAAAFRGDLTADWREQHPDVEPASVLLERIRAERRRQWETAELAKFKAKGKVPKDDSWKKRYVEPERIDDTDLPELPEGWCWASLDDLCTNITDGEHISPATCSDGIPLLSAKDVRESTILFDDVKFVSQEDAVRFWLRCSPNRNDLLIVSRGATVGRSTIVDTDRRFCLMGSVILAKLTDKLFAEYIGRFMESAFAKKHLRSISGATAQQAIYIRDVRACPIPVAPLVEIAEVALGCKKALRLGISVGDSVSNAQRMVDELGQSILAKAFRGELVPQDPNDEPASVLLERIRAERSGDTNGKPVGGRHRRAGNVAKE